MTNKNMAPPIEKFPVQLYDGDAPVDIIDHIIKEILVDIYVNKRRVVTIACAGIHLKELAAGFLRSQGIIETAADIDSIRISDGFDRVYVVTKTPVIVSHENSILSSGAREKRPETAEKTIVSDIRIPAQRALNLMDDHLGATEIHKMTHGTHCSSLANEEGHILVSREDIGRHNTFDMLGGYLLFNNIDSSEKIIATTGRVSSEIVSKVLTLGIPIIISHAVPTAKAITLSNSAGLTIIGYARHGRMKVYSHKERVTF